MFLDNDLIDHLKTKNSIDVDSLIIAEWNQNSLLNIENYGNYRWRPESQIFDDIEYKRLMSEYDSTDAINSYNDALESNTISKYIAEDPENPLIFLTPKVKFIIAMEHLALILLDIMTMEKFIINPAIVHGMRSKNALIEYGKNILTN